MQRYLEAKEVIGKDRIEVGFVDSVLGLSRWLRKRSPESYKEGGLKVKKKSLLIIAILSVLLVGVGTAYAVIGVGDDVPGQDLVIPFMCGRTDVDSSNTLNTLYTIAEVKGGGPVGVNWVSTDRLLYNSRSVTTMTFRHRSLPTIFFRLTATQISTAMAC